MLHRILQRIGSILTIVHFLQKTVLKSHSCRCRLWTGPASVAKRPRDLCEVTLSMVTNKREKCQQLNKIQWDILLEFIIEMYNAFLDSTTGRLHFMSPIGSVTLSETKYITKPVSHRLTDKQELSSDSISPTLKGNEVEWNDIIWGPVVCTWKSWYAIVFTRNFLILY